MCLSTAKLVQRDRMPDEPAATANAVALKLSDLWPSDPELWFVQASQAKALFEAQNITQQITKFAHHSPTQSKSPGEKENSLRFLD